MARPYAYLRRSAPGAVATNGRLSYDAQRAAVLDLAARRGDPEPELVVEWGVSGAAAASAFGGTARGGRRKAIQELRAAVVGGQVSALYAYSLSRLARSTRELLELAEACVAAGVPIRLAKEGDIDGTSASGRLYLTVLAAVATFEAEISQERAKDTIAARKARGDHVGSAGFGKRLEGGQLVDSPHDDVSAVVEAWRAAGSYQRAARDLNAAGVATKTGSAWAGNTVRNIIRRTVPAGELASRRIEPRVRSRGSYALSRLLRCSCGTMLTGKTTLKYRDGRREAGYVSYLCHRGRNVPGHPRPYMVSERELLPWIRAEADRYQLPEAVEVLNTGSGLRDELEAQRAHVTRLALVPGVDLDTVQGQLAAIDEQLAGLEDEAIVEDVGPIDWHDTPPGELNAQLRAYWREVRLDTAMRPIEADWRIARMRDLTAAVPAS
jgi:DNA invertase Pin-like site-specific DNA recombinase